ncbi:dynamin family protein [Streptomyces sp. NPDC058676]|uniref:dynamin family protein n=1 Tax=unclassified Streptomyces TaxID=2593676 RepID=UPI00364A301E
MPKNADADDLGGIARKRLVLLELTQRQSTVVRELRDDAVAGDLADLEKQVRDGRFTVMIVGDFNRGKSTLVNAILGDRVLPTKPEPTTAVITEVHYAEQATAHLYPTSDNGLTPEPVPVDVDRLEEYLAVDQDDPEAASPYKRAVVRWPVDLCRDGVVLVDSPGLNNINVHTDITLNYLQSADAVIMVVDATVAFAENERHYLESRIRANGHEDVLFVITKTDTLDEYELPIALQSIRRTVENLRRPREALFFVRAKQALNGRMSGDQELIESSGITEFEEALSEFLARERGRVQLLIAANRLGMYTAMAHGAVADRRRLAASSRAELERRHAALQPDLLALEARRQRFLDGAGAVIDEAHVSIDARARDLLRTIADRCVDWAVTAETEAGIGWSLRVKKNAEALAKELGAAIAARAESEVSTWQAEVLRPVLETHGAVLSTVMESEVERFEADLKALRSALFAAGTSDTIGEGAGPGVGERTVATVLGWVGGGPALGFAGARFGMKGMLKQAAPIMGGLTVGILLGVGTGGLAFIAMGIAAALNLKELPAAEKKVRQAIGERLRDQLLAQREAHAAKMATEAVRGLRDATSKFASGLHTEIESVRSQVDAALEAKRRGGEAVAAELRLLDTLAAELDRIDHDTAELLAGLDPLPGL